MVSTRRSARSSGTGPEPPEGAPSEPASSAARATAARRRSRDASPPGSDRETGGLHPLVVSSDDKTPKQPMDAEKHRRGKDEVVIEETDEDEESLEEPPGWLPDGWIMEAHRDGNGSIYRYYTSPMSRYTFSSKVETLHYLFSGMDERFLESKAFAEENELHRSHTWLPGGWLIEVRAGGKKMDKMYKFYVHLPTGKRFLWKEDVLCYANEGKVSTCDPDVLCDTSTDDNILAHLEFSPDGLPDGWVKEVIFRRCNDGIRKDPYYTDPVSHHVFRTLRSVLSYLKSGEISRHAYMPRRSVTDMYSFDICADLPQSMLKRLKVEEQTKQKNMPVSVLDKDLSNGHTSNHPEGDTSALLTQSDPKADKYETVKAREQKRVNSGTSKRPPGRPKKLSMQTNKSNLDTEMIPHKETKTVDVKIEVDTAYGDDIPNKRTLEYTAEKHTIVIQEVDNNSVERNPSMRKHNNEESMTASDLHDQENGKLSKVNEEAACSTVHKFYMRRSSNQILGSKKV